MVTCSCRHENAFILYTEAVQMNEERAAGETEFEDESSFKEKNGNKEEAAT